MLDPVLIAALGTGLVVAMTKLVDEGVAEPLAEKGFESLVKLITRKYDQAKDQENLRRAFGKALDKTVQPLPDGDATRLWIINRLTDLKPFEAKMVAAAAVEMERKNADILPENLLNTLNWD
jgi:hypothetical protein